MVGAEYGDAAEVPAVRHQSVIGGGGAAHTGNSREPLMQVAEELRKRLIAVSGLTGVDAEQQQMLAVEAQFDGIQFADRSNEEAGSDEQQQRHGDLVDNE